MRPAEVLSTDRRQDGISIVMPYVKRQVPVNPLKRTGPDQGPGAAGSDGTLDSIQRPLFQQITRPIAGRSGLDATSLLPQVRDVPEPESRRLIVHLHCGDVVLHIRIFLFALNLNVVPGIHAGRLCSAQERRAVVRAKARLPLVAEVLTRLADQVVGGDESVLESSEVANCRPHADRVPPCRVEAHARVE